MRFRRTHFGATGARISSAFIGSIALVAALMAVPVAAQAPATTAPASQTAAPAPAPAAAATPPVAPLSQGTYRINISDEIEVYVWGEERLQRQLRVLPDGTVAFPLVGQFRVQGLLASDVERLVSDRLKNQYRGEVPNVTVSVRNPSGMQFSVMGKVRSPGVLNPGRYLNVIDAISLAGGPAEFANMDNISIIRNQDGRLTTMRVKLGGVFRGNASAGDLDRANAVPLVPGDIVIVP